MCNHLVWLLATALLVTVLTGCIKRQMPTEDNHNASSANAGAKLTYAPQESTGMYGKVPSEDTLGGDIATFALHGKTDAVELSTISVEGQDFDKAIRANIKGVSGNTWDVQLQAKNKQGVERGDVLLASFYFRTEWAPQESGEGQTEFVFELAQEPWTKSASYPVRASRDWKKVYVPFVAEGSYEPGQAQIIFRLGYSAETIDIGGVKLENFKKRLALADLPVTRITYRGSEPDASWRKAAQERIEQHRKGDLKVLVQDAQGKPVAGASVKVELTRHDFAFGTAVVANKLANPGSEDYKRALVESFNYATLENNLKWVALDGDWGQGFTLDGAKRAVAWLQSKEIPTRGHVLIWPGWRNLPRSLKKLEGQPEQLRAKVRSHITELATEMKGLVPQWDVMNEPFDNHDLIDILGKDEVVEWFKLARAAEPSAKLFINDYAILSGGGGDTPHRKHYEEMIQFMLERQAPFDGIGLQGHFGTSLTAPEDLLVLLDRFAKFDKVIYITEYDVVVDEEQLAADYTRDFYTTLMSHPAVGGIFMWGFWDGSHWKKNSAMYRTDWTLKPAGEAYRKLVLDEWRSRAQGQTDNRGLFSARGFLGEYSVEVRAAGKKKLLKTRLNRAGSSITVTLD